MKVLRIVVIAILALGTCVTAGWTLAKGLNAPDSKKITASTPLVQNTATTAEGIEMLGEVFANQVEEPANDIYELENTQNTLIPECKAKLEAQKEAYAKALEDKARLGELKSLNKKQREELQAADAVIAEYKATEANLATYESNVVINKDNIAAYEAAKAEAVAEGENIVALANSVSITMIWCYILAIAAIVIIVGSLLHGVIQDPRKLISGGILLLIVAAVIGIAYAVALSHGWADGETLKDAAGYDLGIGTDPTTRTVFSSFEYMISDTSIIVCYIVAGMALLAAGFSVIRGLFK